MQKRIFVILAVVTGAVALVAVPAATATKPHAAHAAAKARTDSGTVYAAVVHPSAGQAVADGDVKSKLFGTAAITYLVTLGQGSAPGTATIVANRITLWTKNGSLSGTGRATQTTNPDGTAQVTNGTFKLTKGTGALKGHRFAGTFSGPFNGSYYTFAYKGVYR